jgi:hypothetical protein
MGFEPVKLGSLECPVYEPNHCVPRDLTPSSDAELLGQMSMQADRSSGGDRSHVRDSADDREMHRASLLDRSPARVNVQEIRRLLQ